MHSDSAVVAREKRRDGGWLVVLGIIVGLTLFLVVGGPAIVSVLGLWKEQSTEFVYLVKEATPTTVPTAYAVNSKFPTTGSKAADKMILNIKSAGTRIVLEGLPDMFFLIAGAAEVGDEIRIRLPEGKTPQDVSFDYLLDYTVIKKEKE